MIYQISILLDGQVRQSAALVPLPGFTCFYSIFKFQGRLPNFPNAINYTLWLSGFSAHSLPERQVRSPLIPPRGQRVVFLGIEFQSSVWFGFHKAVGPVAVQTYW